MPPPYSRSRQQRRGAGAGCRHLLHNWAAPGDLLAWRVTGEMARQRSHPPLPQHKGLRLREAPHCGLSTGWRGRRARYRVLVTTRGCYALACLVQVRLWPLEAPGQEENTGARPSPCVAAQRFIMGNLWPSCIEECHGCRLELYETGRGIARGM